MMTSTLRRTSLSAVLLGLLLGCGGETLQSQWLDREITIDGDPTEWSGALHWMEKSELDVGVLNDEDHLYICLIVGRESDRRQIMVRGMTLWFDASGGDDQRLGIHYPIGFSASDLSPSEMQALAEEMRDRQRDGDRAGKPSDSLVARFEASLAMLEILRGQSAPHRYDPGAVPGIEVAVHARTNSMVYELKIPLRGGAEFSLGTSAGAKIGVHLTTPEIDREAMEERMQGGGGMPPGGGMGGGAGAAGRPPPGRMLPPSSLDLKAKLQLAEPSVR